MRFGPNLEFGMFISVFVVLYIFYLFLMPVYSYLLLKWRSYRDNQKQDPQLGAKVTVYFFKTLAYHFVLLGAMLVFYSLLDLGFYFTVQPMKIGLGLLLGSGLVYGFAFVLKGSLANSYLVCRLYTAFNFIIVGILAMAFLLFFFVALMSLDRISELHFPLVGLVVYGAAAALQGYFYLKPRIK